MAPVPMAMPVVVMAGMIMVVMIMAGMVIMIMAGMVVMVMTGMVIMITMLVAGMVMLARSVLVGVPIRHRTHLSTVIGDRLLGSLPTTHSDRG